MNDVIFALATPPGRGALHLHRLSGPGVFAKLLPYLASPRRQPLRFSNSSSCTQTKYVLLQDEHQQLIDDGIATLYLAPKSYTGEETLELTLHGNPLLSKQAQSLFRRLGFRDARPGEFTQRAFLNGKIDLAQAEGVAQLIDAESADALQLARDVTSGRLSHAATQLRDQLIEVLAYLEAHVDFGADEIGAFDAQSVLPKLNQVNASLTALADSYSYGEKMKSGLKLALIGQPNAGKSSLYNALLQAERAIVTDIAGTTRDVLSERLVVDKRDFVLLDTAGIRTTNDRVEKIGIERSRQTMRDADCVLVVTDIHSAQMLVEVKTILVEQLSVLLATKLESHQRAIVVIHKSDLLSEQFSLHQVETAVKNCVAYPIVFTHHHDVQALRAQLVAMHDELTHRAAASQHPFLISQRQLDKVNLAKGALAEVFKLADSQMAHPETMASLVHAARIGLEELVGEVTLDSIFDKLFSDFCIGK